MSRARSLGVLAAFGIALSAPPVRADELRAHATLGLAHAVGEPQGREFGPGALGSLSLEIPATRAIGAELKVSGLVLAKGDPPRDPSLAAQSTGTAGVGTAGVRLRPFTRVAGPWASIGAGAAATGNRVRFAADAAIGWDFRVSRANRWDVGPYVGLLDVVQPDDSLRPNDAYVFSVGVHLGLGVPDEKPKPASDRDHDAIPDAADACPDVAGVATTDPRTNGCPRADRDKDAVFDDEDACPDVPGVRTADRKTNGCPRADRDKDAVFDDEDACPDVPGIRTADRKTNGCPPPDRDADGVLDAEDACPDVAGVRTDDPKTSGCPLQKTGIRIENDRIMFDEVIHFDLDSPRVRHASFPLVKKLAAFINDNPDILEVSIEGHTDATGTEKHNLALSRQRAESVRALLVKFGVDGKRLKAEAFGRSHLKVQTNRAEAENRRAEFWITRTRQVSGAGTP